MIIGALSMPMTSSTSSAPCLWFWCLLFIKCTMSDCDIYRRLPHDLSEDQQMSLLQPMNKIDLVFSKGSIRGRKKCKSQASPTCLCGRRPEKVSEVIDWKSRKVMLFKAFLFKQLINSPSLSVKIRDKNLMLDFHEEHPVSQLQLSDAEAPETRLCNA